MRGLYSNMMYFIIRTLVYLRRWFLYLFDTAVIRSVKTFNRKGDVLVVRVDAIGDFFLWLDAAEGLRQVYPREQYRIILLGNSVWAELAKGLPHWDEVWPLNKDKFVRNLFYRMKTLRKVRSTGFEIALQPTLSREFEFGDAVMRACGSHKKIGSSGDSMNMSLLQKRNSDRWYTHLLPASDGPMMELLRNAEFMRGLGIQDFKSDVPRLPLSFALPDAFKAANYFVIFPGAAAVYRQWPLHRFKELSERIHVMTGWSGVICGGSSEKHLGEQLQKKTAAPLENWCGKTSLEELVAIISGSRFLLSNETSAVHIAAALYVTSVCILGGGHHGRFMPYQVEIETTRPLPVAVYYKMNCFNCNWICRHNRKEKDPVVCIEKITVDMVWEAVEKILMERFGYSDDKGKSEILITSENKEKSPGTLQDERTCRTGSGLKIMAAGRHNM